jgi:hypothetical protein
LAWFLDQNGNFGQAGVQMAAKSFFIGPGHGKAGRVYGTAPDGEQQDGWAGVTVHGRSVVEDCCGSKGK